MCVTSPMEVGGCFWGQDYSRLRSFRGDGGFLCTSPLPACRTWGSPQGPHCSECLPIVKVGTQITACASSSVPSACLPDL